MIVLDASVLIAQLDRTDVHHDRAGSLLHETGDEPLVASPLTLAEVLVAPARAGRLDQAAATLGQLEVRSVDLGPDAPRRLAALRAETRLRLPDCCVLLTVEQTHATLATFDFRLAAAGRGRGHVVLGSEQG